MITAPIIRKAVPKKPPPKRLFSGVAGSPLATVHDSAPMTAPEPAQVLPVVAPAVPVSRGRGRPRKYADTAAKQAAYRTRLATKNQDSEFRDTLAEILWRVRVGMPDSRSVVFGSEIKQEN